VSTPSRQALDDLADEHDEPMLVADGFDEAIRGTAQVFLGGGWRTLVTYDRALCIETLIKRDGMSEEDAEEYFEYNVQGAIIDGGPLFISRL